MEIVGERHPESLEIEAMKIVIITQGVTPMVIAINNEFDVVGIAESLSSRKQPDWRRILNPLVRTLRGPRPLESFSSQCNIPYFKLTGSNMLPFAEWISKRLPDIICVYSMSQLLPEHVLKIPRLGAINLHPSDLPRYRGPNPCFWTLFENSLSGGVTIHSIDKGEDTGLILARESIPVTEQMTLSELERVTAERGAQLMVDTLHNIEQRIREGKPQPKVSPTRRAERVSSMPEFLDLATLEAPQIENGLRRRLFGLEDLCHGEPEIKDFKWDMVSSGQLSPGSGKSGKVEISRECCTLYCQSSYLKLIRSPDSE